MYEPDPSPQRAPSSAAIAAWILIIFACTLALVPVLGFAVWLIAAPILLVTLVLGIIAASDGRAVNGTIIILASLIVAPLFILCAPIISTLVVAGAASNAESALNEASNTAAPAESSYLLEEQDHVDNTIFQETATDVSEDEDQYSPPAASHPVPARTAATRAPASPPSGSTEPPTGFPYPARIVDPLGRASIVLQSTPSMLGKNLHQVAVGTLVHASGFDGEWINVRLDDGQVGYVRRKQLLFPE